MLGAHGVPRGVQIIAESFEDRTAIACAAMLEALGASFKPADGLALSAAARPTARGTCVVQVRRVSVIARLEAAKALTACSSATVLRLNSKTERSGLHGVNFLPT
jgi:hypothetical protein